MGMDVFGTAPTSEAGEYFRRSVWGWRPLADFILAEASDEAAGCLYWHSNDGDGLGAAEAVKLADRLQQAVADGTAAAWVLSRDATLGALPDETCRYCAGTGSRTDAVGVQMRMAERVCEGDDHPRRGRAGWCNGCDGRGVVRPFATHYPLEVSDVAEFATFLRASGGFRIC